MIMLGRLRLFTEKTSLLVTEKTLLLGRFAIAMIVITAVSADRLSWRGQCSRLRDHQAVGIH
jgi:hypothetical protein